jgi:hypothetical protein
MTDCKERNKSCRDFLLILTEVQKVLQNVLGNPRTLKQDKDNVKVHTLKQNESVNDIKKITCR